MLTHWKKVVLGAFVACVVLLGATLALLQPPLLELPRGANSQTETAHRVGTVPLSPLPPPSEIRLTWPEKGGPPFCTFAETVNVEVGAVPAPPVSYVFSEPRVVFQASSNVGVAQWLPDNRRILLAHAVRDPDTAAWELFDTLTASSEVVGRQNLYSLGQPIWLPDLEKILFLDYRIVEGASGPVRWSIWYSGAKNPDAAPLIGDGEQYSTTVDSSGALIRLQTATSSLTSLPQSATALNLPPPLRCNCQIRALLCLTK